MNQILVIGSSNTDMVIKTDKLPCPGETIIGGIFMVNSGGKGANQAVAAATGFCAIQERDCRYPLICLDRELCPFPIHTTINISLNAISDVLKTKTL